MNTGALILCGGKSSRMGTDKATLPFGPEVMLQRVIRLLGQVVDQRNIVVVASAEQQLPVLPIAVMVTRDRHPDRGPLEGLAAGLTALGPNIEAVYVTSCDAPLLEPAFVRRMFELLGDNEVAVPCEGEQLHPLAAVYRPSVLKHIQDLLQADRLRLQSLFERARTCAIPVDELRSVDGELRTLFNMNRPEDYEAALKFAGV